MLSAVALAFSSTANLSIASYSRRAKGVSSSSDFFIRLGIFKIQACKVTPNGVNVGESCSAADVARHRRSSSSKILAAGNRRVPVKVACWSVRTMLRAGKLETYNRR